MLPGAAPLGCLVLSISMSPTGLCLVIPSSQAWAPRAPLEATSTAETSWGLYTARSLGEMWIPGSLNMGGIPESVF